MKKTLFRWLIALAILLPCLCLGVVAEGGAAEGQGITQYRYREKQFTTSQTELDAPWELYDSETEYLHTGYKRVYISRSLGGTSSGYTESGANQWAWDNRDQYCFHGSKKPVYMYIRKTGYTNATGPQYLYLPDGQYPDYTYYVPSGPYWRFEYCTRKEPYQVYSYFKWDEWSEWSETAVTATDNRQVETREVYTVTYNANGGESAPGSQRKIYDEDIVLSADIPSRDGYTFLGWATQPDSDVEYEEGSTYSSNKSVTLYAVWKASAYTITYHANGGVGEPEPQTKINGVPIELLKERPTREDYVFRGWATSATGTVVYIPGACYTENKDADLYAVWVAVGAEVIASGTCGADNANNYLDWTLDNTGVLAVYGFGRMADFGQEDGGPWRGLNVRRVVIDYGVTGIGNSAFRGCYELTSVTIPDSVTSIGEHAFDCCNLTSVTIPDSVTSIANYVFRYCENLTRVTSGDNVTSIGDYAFYGCTSLTGVTIPNSVTNIGDYAFYECYSLTSVTIPDSVTTIGNSAFRYCGLTSVTIPDSVTSIGVRAFFGTSLTRIEVAEGNTVYCDVEGVLFSRDKTRLVLYPCSRSGSYTVPGGVTDIGDGAFEFCSSLTSVTIPDSVTGMGDNALYRCDSLTSVSIPDSVTSIGNTAFANCASLTQIKVGEGNTAYCDVNGVLFSKDVTLLMQYPGGNKAESYTIPDSVTRIEERAFYYCTGLTSVTIPDSVTSIGNSAFSSCTGLTSVTIGDSVAVIEDSAFNNCGLTSVTIPDSVASIGNYAFASCSKLARVDFLCDMPTSVGSQVFRFINKVTLYYHAGTTGWPTDGTWQGRPLAMQPHTETALAAVSPACEKSGLTQGSCCDICGEVLLAQTEIPATGHTAVTDVAVAPTCTATGLTKGSHCGACGEVLVAQETIAKINHKVVVDNPKPATCTEAGYADAGVHCSACGEVLLAQTEIPATGHNEVVDKVAVAPTCTKTGLTAGSRCDTCGEVLVAQTEIPALGHDIIDHAAKAPTTESVGWEAYQTCSRCDYSTYKELPKLAPTQFKFSLEVIKTIKVNGQNVDICRWVWTPVEA